MEAKLRDGDRVDALERHKKSGLGFAPIKLEPLENRVVVLPDVIDEKLGSGILVKAEFTKTQDNRTQTEGVLIAVSGCAFADWEGKKPKVGDRILFAMYAGQYYSEGETQYRVMNDQEVVGILKE